MQFSGHWYERLVAVWAARAFITFASAFISFEPTNAISDSPDLSLWELYLIYIAFVSTSLMTKYTVYIVYKHT